MFTRHIVKFFDILRYLCQGFVGVHHSRLKLVRSESDSSSKQDNQGSHTFTDKLARRIQLLMDTARKLKAARWGKSDSLAIRRRTKGEPEEILERLVNDGACDLYDLSTNPEEKYNIAAENLCLVPELKQTLRKMTTQAASVQMTYSTAEEEAEVEKRLRDLGYF